DYHDLARVSVHADWTACLSALAARRLFALTTRGGVRYDAPRFQAEDVFVFGSETRGLPEAVHAAAGEEHRLRLPMLPSNRSMNLSNTVAIVVFEAWRQLDFADGS